MSHQFTASLRRWSVVLAVSLSATLVVPATALAGVAPGTVPTITSPADASTASTSPLTVTATSAATQVRFTLDAGGVLVTQTVSVTGASATADLSVYGLKGSATVSAADCLTGACNLIEDSIGVTLDLPAPVITSPTNNKVVGNSVTVQATAPGGSLQFLLDGNAVDTDLSAPFEESVSLDGKSQGSHAITVKQCNVAGTICQGATDNVTVIKDTHGPKWSELGVSTSPFYPVNDGYKDTTNLSAKVGEKSSETKVEIRKQGGPVVRTIKLGRVDQGRIKVTRNGKKNNGDIVAAGKYTFQFIGTDANGVVGKSSEKVVQVSDKKLVKKNVTKTVSALGSGLGDYSGKCSRVTLMRSLDGYARNWKNGLQWQSNFRRNCTGSASVALSAHVIKTEQAVRYGDFQISTYGGASLKNGGPAKILYVKKNETIGARQTLGTGLGWHKGDRESLDKYLFGSKLLW
ncbi:MAG: Ig-like domain-containing protein [Actinomycetia bacterium]|nr:Ig-like domain-containing protein [Actinomycetes bacterium]